MENLLNENEFDLDEKETVEEIHLHMNGVQQRLMLTKKQKLTNQTHDSFTPLNFLFNSYRKFAPLLEHRILQINLCLWNLLQMNVIKFLGKLNVVVIQRLMVNSNLLRTQKLFTRETEHKLVVSKIS